ncbi:hypothetical protein LV779_26500 [Streptomyces thinghirensis]|nr:hypothetical protein [Streptomyces thinghirensis]
MHLAGDPVSSRLAPAPLVRSVRSALSAWSRKDCTSTRRAPTATPTATAMPAAGALEGELEPPRARGT